MSKWIPFVLIFAFFTFSDQWLTLRIHALLSDSENLSPWLYGLVAISFLNGLLLPLFAAMFFFLTRRHPVAGNRARLVPPWDELTKEQMRVIGQTVAWGLLLIIPGFVRYFQCVFVPLVVLYDGDYNQGKVDALTRSRHLLRPVWGRVLGWFALFGVVIPLTLVSFNEARSFFDAPVSAFGFLLLDVALFAVFQWGLLKFWERGQNVILHSQTNP